MSIAEEFDRPTRDDVQEDRIKVLADELARLRKPISDMANNPQDMQTRVILASTELLTRQTSLSLLDLSKMGTW